MCFTLNERKKQENIKMFPRSLQTNKQKTKKKKGSAASKGTHCNHFGD
jgi:hypothetical protein